MIRMRALVTAFAVAALSAVTANGALAQCVGDCNGDGTVRINELIQGVNIALDEAQLDICPAFDSDGDGAVRIGELITAVNNALNGCPPAPTATSTPSTTPSPMTDTPMPTDTPTPGDDTPTPSDGTPTATSTPMTAPECGDGVVNGEEQCDDGRHCARGDAVGDPCSSDDDCAGVAGACELRSGDGCQADCRLPVCGDGVVDGQAGSCGDNVCVGPNPAAGSACTGDSDCLGETCDDGNTDEGADDACPANCQVATCIPSGERVTANVNFASNPDGTIVSGLELFVRYAEDTVSIPGSANAPEVTGRIASPGNVFSSITPNDRNYGLVLVLFDSTLFGVDPGTAVTIEFDLCEGTPAPTAGDFTCAVNSASDLSLLDVTDQITCEVELQ